MNERIQELAEQAGWIMSDEVEGFNTRLEKFADLIIQECLLSLEPDSMAPKSVDYAVEEKFYCRSVEKIKQHFEIE